jgi:alpha-2-macroglobulin
MIVGRLLFDTSSMIALKWQSLLVALALPLSPCPLLHGQAASPEETEVRDLSATPIRKVDASIYMSAPGWNIPDKKVSGPAVVIEFGGPAAPLDQVGKALGPGLIRINPEVLGEWKWVNAQRLEFFPAGGWLPPGGYRFQARDGLLADDCQLAENSHFGKLRPAPKLTADFGARNYYIDPETPGLQQLVTTVTFSQAVSLEEASRHFSVTSVTGIEIFQAGSQAQILPEPEDPRRFYLRSPLMKPGEKEDLILFNFAAGMRPVTGGEPTQGEIQTKLTAYSRDSLFFIDSVGSMLRKTADGEPEQALLVQLSLPAMPASLAKSVEAWKLPPEEMDESGRWRSWTKENVGDEVLAKSEKLELDLVSTPGAPAMEQVLVFRVPQQPGGKVFVKMSKGIAGPGGFVTPEDYREVTALHSLPREALVMGNGGLLALNGERKISVQSRGIDHLRYTVARVQTDRINHLVSQTHGRFESPSFQGGFGFADLSDFEQSVQGIAKQGEYAVNYSSFDFAPLVDAERAGADNSRGLFYLSVEGVRPRTPDDGEAAEKSPDRDWLPLTPEDPRNYGYVHRSDSDPSYPAGDRMRDGRFILVTDLGLIMKEEADGGRAIFVQSFSARGPVEAVELSVLARNGRVLKTATTDAAGMAWIPSLRGLERELTPVALVANKGDDLAFIPWAKYERLLDISRYDVGGVAYSDASALTATLFTERGIYRPGEEIHVGGIVRQRDWLGELAGLPVELVVVNAKRDVAGRYPLKLEAGGVFSHTIPTAESAPTGPWWVSLERPKSEEGAMRRESLFLGDKVVRVEEFQPDRLKIRARFQADASDGWCSPDGLEVTVQLDTLFGMAAANRRIAAKLHLTPASPNFSKWPGWTFGLTDRQRRDTQEIPLTDATTDEHGRAKLTLNMEAHTAPMLQARVELEGFEADGGRGVRTSLSTLVSPQAYLIGHKAERSLGYLDERDLVAVEVMAIGPDGEAVAVGELTRVLVQTTHVSVLTKQGSGSLAYESQARDETVETVKISLPAKAQAMALPLGTPGNFRYEFRNAAGQTLCSIPFHVAGKGKASKNLERSGELEIHFADKQWLPGEELEFSLTSPFTGAGLITVERDRVLESKWFQVDSKTSVQSIRLPDQIEGGVYLSVVMARALDSPDVFLNPLASGIMPIAAARGEREMAVTLDAVDRVRPGERLAIGYEVPKEGKVVIWAVDEGIHLVSSYGVPDPLLRLLPTAALEVETYQLMDVLMPEFSLLRKALAIGGGDDGEAGAAIPELAMGLNPFKRRRDAPVVFWSGFVNAGAERQEVFYDVPEYFAGRLKIMAVAVSDDSAGVGEAETIVKGDFVLQATAPLFVVPGDEFTASVTIANQMEGEAATDQVKVEVETLGGIEIIEAAPEAHTIPVGKEVTVSYRCRATGLLGNGELKFTASSGTSVQVTRSSFSVRPGVARAAKVQSGWFRNGSHDVALDRAMFGELAERQAVVSTTPLGLAHGLSAYLREFPHGCTEQITSRAFPWLVLKDDANFGLDREEAAEAIADVMNQLSARQGANGGFGWWSAGSPEGFDYVTVYVGHFLTECKRSGFDVPARLYQATMRRLRHMADAEVAKPSGSDPYRFEQTRREADLRAAAIYLLTRNEEVTTNYALKLQDFMEANVPKELWHRDPTAVWLASTWRLLKKETAAMQLLDAHRAEVKKPLPENWRHGYYFYQSKLTREATTFTVLCRHFPEIAGQLTYDEMKPLTEMIEQGDFHTLSAAWSIQALKAYADLAKDSGVKAGIAAVRGDQVEVLAEPAMGQLQVNVPEGMVRFFFADDAPPGLGAWYQTIEKGFAKEVPDEAGGKHIEIRRELLDADGEAVTHGKLGETLFARLTIRNLTKTELPNLAITEMLPGGFEFAPPGEADSLRPGLATRQGTDYIDVREDRALIYLGLGPEGSLSLQYALRPTCVGNYLVPPPYAEDMYESTVRANGAGGKLMVFPRN